MEALSIPGKGRPQLFTLWVLIDEKVSISNYRAEMGDRRIKHDVLENSSSGATTLSSTTFSITTLSTTIKARLSA
jgi:hypothetical protein